ncbi:MAG TPA: acyl-CoA dehydrogenase family protein [Planctomycetota bacterium]
MKAPTRETEMHNLELTEDQELVVDTVARFAADTVAANVLDQDEHRVFARAAFDGLAELGVFGLLVGEASGGAGLGFLPFVAALEATGAQSSSLARLWIGQLQCALLLEATRSDKLDGVMAGATLASYAGLEHGLRLQHGRLHGKASLVPGALEAQLFVVAALSDGKPVLATVEASAVTRAPLRCLGLASAGCASVGFDGAAATVLAGDAAAAISRAQFAAWVGVAATAVGAGFACVQAARKHAAERIAFGKPLLAQEAVVRKLVECRRQSEAARHLTWHAARLADLGQDGGDAAMQARLLAVDAMVNAADEAIQIHGGYGYTVEYHVERHYRDGKTLEVLDGGAQDLLQRLAARQFA